ncbi:MAG: FKBP-type peptidyl-prolyl cis-trans isomerase N-terminal domain-containing protein [Aureispira sp.]
MKHYTIIWISVLLLWGNSTISAQQTEPPPLAYYYGITIGYELKLAPFPYQVVSLTALEEAVSAYGSGRAKLSKKEATTVLQTVGKDSESIQETAGALLGYAYGVLIVDNWREYEIAVNKEHTTALLKGIHAVFEADQSIPAYEEVQKELMQYYKQLQEEKLLAKTEANSAFLLEHRDKAGVQILENGVQYEILQEGVGKPIGSTNKRLKVLYKAHWSAGDVFEDYSQTPIIITRNSVIAGLKSLLPLMRQNQTIKAYIPPHLGYGEQARGEVPAQSILVYEITLIEVLY